MGRRSRRRAAESPDTVAGAAADGDPETRAERDAIRRSRRSARGDTAAAGTARRGAPATPARAAARRPTDQRPPAPWGRLPLTELVLVLSLVMAVGGVAIGGRRGFTMVLASLALAALAGLELALREHFSGYRSHSALFGLVAGTPVLSAIFLLGGRTVGAYAVGVAAGAAAFAAAFLLARRAFRRRSGGLSFR